MTGAAASNAPNSDARIIVNTARVSHPGAILREEFLARRGLSVRALAIALQVPAPRIDEVVRERRNITNDIAQRLARYFDTTPQFWMNLQASYDSKVTRRKFKGRPSARGRLFR